jgi:hypothetical protein
MSSPGAGRTHSPQSARTSSPGAGRTHSPAARTCKAEEAPASGARALVAPRTAAAVPLVRRGGCAPTDPPRAPGPAGTATAPAAAGTGWTGSPAPDPAGRARAVARSAASGQAIRAAEVPRRPDRLPAVPPSGRRPGPGPAARAALRVAVSSPPQSPTPRRALLWKYLRDAHLVTWVHFGVNMSYKHAPSLRGYRSGPGRA